MPGLLFSTVVILVGQLGPSGLDLGRAGAITTGNSLACRLPNGRGTNVSFPRTSATGFSILRPGSVYRQSQGRYSTAIIEA